jgi:hypothetical protein
MPDQLHQQNAELIARIIRLGLGAAGIGAAYRGATGLRDLITRNDQLIDVPPLEKSPDTIYSGKPSKKFPVHKAPRPLRIPVRAEKAAGLIDQAGEAISNLMPTEGLPGIIGGSSVQDPLNAPWVLPATAAVVGGGAYGGYKLMDWLLAKRRKHELAQRLHAARDEYQRALGEGVGGKMAAETAATPAERLGRVFDMLAAQCQHEKTATPYPFIGDVPEKALGALLLVNLGLAGAAGATTYHYTKQRNNVELLRKALRERARQRSSIRPEQLMAFPEPVAA